MTMMKWYLIGGFLHQSVGGGVCHWRTSLSVTEGRSNRRAQLDLASLLHRSAYKNHLDKVSRVIF